MVFVHPNTLASAGIIPGVDRQSIDQICYSSDMAASRPVGLSNLTPDGRAISDHFGLHAKISTHDDEEWVERLSGETPH